MEQYKNQYFESSSGLTPEFASFTRTAKKYLTTELSKHNLDVIKFSRGHFDFSLFAKNRTTNKIVYISVCDIRPYFTGQLYYRTAEHDKDYKGGMNNWCDINEVASNAERITNGL